MEADESGVHQSVELPFSEVDVLWGSVRAQNWHYFGERYLVGPFKFKFAYELVRKKNSPYISLRVADEGSSEHQRTWGDSEHF